MNAQQIFSGYVEANKPHVVPDAAKDAEVEKAINASMSGEPLNALHHSTLGEALIAIDNASETHTAEMDAAIERLKDEIERQRGEKLWKR